MITLKIIKIMWRLKIPSQCMKHNGNGLNNLSKINIDACDAYIVDIWRNQIAADQKCGFFRI